MEFSVHICEYNRSNADYETIYRPEGSGDYLFLLFKTPMKVYDRTAFFIAQENACLFTRRITSSIIRLFRSFATAMSISGAVRIWVKRMEFRRMLFFIHRIRKQLMS